MSRAEPSAPPKNFKRLLFLFIVERHLLEGEKKVIILLKGGMAAADGPRGRDFSPLTT